MKSFPTPCLCWQTRLISLLLASLLFCVGAYHLLVAEDRWSQYSAIFHLFSGTLQQQQEQINNYYKKLYYWGLDF